MIATGGPESIDRHPSDVIRLILGTVIFVCSALMVRRGLGSIERDVSQVVAHIPYAARSVITAITYAGSLAAVLILALAALAHRHYRMAAAIALSGVLAFVVAQTVEPALRVTEFPASNTAVAAALATAARPILRQRWRRTSWYMVWLVGFAQVYLGTAYLVDIVGGAALGLGIGAAVLLVLGAPGGKLSTAALKHALEEAGIQVSEARRADMDQLSWRWNGSAATVSTALSMATLDQYPWPEFGTGCPGARGEDGAPGLTAGQRAC